MSILTVKDLTHSFGGREIFEKVNFRLLKGEHIGLLGANGEGKSTFMKIITNKLEPDEGKILWANKVRVGYMDQHAELNKDHSIKEALDSAFDFLFDKEKEMNDLYAKMGDVEPDELEKLLEETAQIQDLLETNEFYNIDKKVDEIAKGLGLNDLGLDKKVNDLSGGQRTKILLGKLLLENPDILLLDEPTNYLDEEHIIFLKNYLLNYENAFILISHDMEFFNTVTNVIYHVENTTLTRYPGNYEEFQRVYEANKKQLEAKYKRQQAEIAKLEDFVARNKARVATSGMAKARQKKLDKMEKIELTKEKVKPEFVFMQDRVSDKLVFEAKQLVVGYDEPLSRPIDLYVERGDKIALVGANGIGKSTLMKTLLGLQKPLSGEVETGGNQSIGYFEQEVKEKIDKTCIDDFWDLYPSYTQYEVRRALAKCGLTTELIESKVFVLSGGEQAKTRICKIINRPTNILLLDEPTNHLDYVAKDELQRALKEYKGTIIMVSHEPEFYKGIVDKVIDCSDFTLKEV